MSVVTQGTQLFALIDGAALEIECITAFNPGGSPADQIEDTCLSERSTRTYRKGLQTPGQATVNLNADPRSPSHLRMFQLAQEGGDFEDIQFALGWADGTSTPTVAAGGTVTAVNVTSGGSGYTSAPTVAFSGGGGTGATGTAVIDAGEVIGVNITNAGTGYTGTPTITFTGGGGTGASATAVRTAQSEFVLPTDRTWFTFMGYVSDFPFDFTANAVVATAATIQRSGAGAWIPKETA